MRRALRVVIAGCFAAASASGQGLPPWVEPGRLPLDEGVHSLSVRGRDEPLYTEPDTGAARRGAAARGARLPLFGVARGPGCRTDFYLVGPTAWICGDAVDPSPDAPPSGAADSPSADGLPFRYFFVGADGAFGYEALASAEDTKPSAELEPGFAIAVIQFASRASGDPFGLTTKGLWLPLRDLRAARPADFAGYDVVDGKLDRGFVVVDASAPRGSPGGRRVDGVLRRFETVRVLETRSIRGHVWVEIGEDRWIDGDDVRIPAPVSAPPEIRPGERWIDVDRETQVLTAYEGATPVFATLVSTGIGGGEDPTVTPAGTHRVWVKLRTTDMTNLEDEEARRYYAIQEVPWVLFFDRGYGLHGAFWHQGFGHVRSHGCVNLAPRDAERIFSWSSPRLPPGWSAALPTEYDPGTVVRVR
jgi:hypothetical protein